VYYLTPVLPQTIRPAPIGSHYASVSAVGASLTPARCHGERQRSTTGALGTTWKVNNRWRWRRWWEPASLLASMHAAMTFRVPRSRWRTEYC